MLLRLGLRCAEFARHRLVGPTSGTATGTRVTKATMTGAMPTARRPFHHRGLCRGVPAGTHHATERLATLVGVP